MNSLRNISIISKLEFKKNFKYNIFSAILIFLWILILSRYNLGRGFDFTDSTLTYHYSLQILNGEIPFKDFHTFVMPLAFYFEAFFHWIFGENYIVNAYIGLIIKFLQGF